MTHQVSLVERLPPDTLTRLLRAAAAVLYGGILARGTPARRAVPLWAFRRNVPRRSVLSKRWFWAAGYYRSRHTTAPDGASSATAYRIRGTAYVKRPAPFGGVGSVFGMATIRARESSKARRPAIEGSDKQSRNHLLLVAPGIAVQDTGYYGRATRRRAPRD
jgi:hypothetical protein